MRWTHAFIEKLSNRFFWSNSCFLWCILSGSDTLTSSMKKAKPNKRKNKNVPLRIHECIAVCTYWKQQKQSQLFSKFFFIFLFLFAHCGLWYDLICFCFRSLPRKVPLIKSFEIKSNTFVVIKMTATSI